ncbi:hypothetical protein Tsubulata_000299, partial [Turnera subulata]
SMAMFRAMSVRRNPMRYERLGEDQEPTASLLLEAKLERTKSVPAFVFGTSKSSGQKLGEVVYLGGDAPVVKPAPAPTKKPAKSHPLFSFFDGRRRKKKPTANPELARYLEYLKEGGLMAMFRAMSVRRNPMRYERFGEEPTASLLLDAKLERTKSVPAFVFGSPKSSRQKLEVVYLGGNAPLVKPAPPSKKPAKSHPLFSLFRRKKNPTPNPELARYLEYLKEGGMWDVEANKPVIHYKAMSVRRNPMRYERFGEEPTASLLLEAKLERTKSVPAFVFGSSKSSRQKLEVVYLGGNAPLVKPAPPSKKPAKSHPLFSLFRRKKNPTANPQLARYLEYLKEGGMWDVKSNKPLMAMFRAMSVRRNPRRYERSGEEATAGLLLDAKLDRTKSVPAFVYGSSSKSTRRPKLEVVYLGGNAPFVKPDPPTKKPAKSHPLFSLFRRKKKPTANPQLARYLEYLKEGGMWDVKSNKPAMHYN